MYSGLGQDTVTTLPNLTGQDTLAAQVQGATPDVQNYISQLESWINSGSTASKSSTTSTTSWLNTNAKTIAIVAALGLGGLLLIRMGGR
jgi:hypothetical protein